MKSSVGYTRISQKSDMSIPMQKEKIERYCKEHDLNLIKIFDEGEKQSGFDETRKEYNRMINYVLSNEIDLIIVLDKSRFGRDRFERTKRLIDLFQHGVLVKSIMDDMSIDLQDDLGLVIETIQAYADDVEKRKEIEKSKEIVKKRIEKGYWHGRPPFGFSTTKDRRDIIPNEKFEIAIKCIKMRDEGISYAEISRERGIAISTIHKICNEKREFYLGWGERVSR